MIAVGQKYDILQYANENSGVLLTNQAVEHGFSRATIKELADSGELTFVQRGVYVTDEGYVDDFFLLQQRFKSGIFSHETALYLLGFSDRAPLQITMTFEQGRSTKDIKNEGIRPVMVSNHFSLGKETIIRHSLPIYVYDIERTLVDLLRPRYDADFEQLMPALKKYASYDKKDINKLFRYARMFKVEKRMQDFMGVLL